MSLAIEKQTIAACPLCMFMRLNNDKIALVDPEDWAKLHHYNWRAKLSKGGWYAYRKYVYNGKTYIRFMHREIMNCPYGLQTHHKNRSTLDNRKANLENVTPEHHKQQARQARITKYRIPLRFLEAHDLPIISSEIWECTAGTPQSKSRK